MRTKLHLFIAILLLSTSAMAQKYITKTGTIHFYSSTPMEDIEAHNKQVNSALDTETGDFVFKVLIKSFKFEKSLMQEHFNENYMDSDKFPKATFQGKITNLSDLNFNKEGTYEANIEGKLSIHGQNQSVSEKGTFTVEKKSIKGYAKFNIKIDDYGIEIPLTVINNIAESIEVTVDVDLKPLK